MATKALFLTHTPPLPLVSGERIRNFHLLRAAARAGVGVSLFSLDHGVRPSEQEEAELRDLCEGVVLAPLDGSRAARYGRAAIAVLTRTAFHRRFFYTREAAGSLRRFLADEAFDVIVGELLYMYPYAPPEHLDRVLLDTHNAETRRVEAMADALGGSLRGLAARLQVGPVRSYEGQALRDVARVVAVSELDRVHLERLAGKSVDVVPNGVDCAAIQPRESLPSAPRLLFLGSLDYHANADAAEYLIEEILPRLRRRDASAVVVGRGAPRSLRRAARGSAVPVELAGFVQSTAPFFEECRVFVVPIRFGGGTRLKILEALARGVSVVTTSAGCEGLDLVHEHDLVIADDPDDFAAWVDRLLEDDRLAAQLAAQGRRTVEARYDWEQLGASFTSILEQVANRSSS